MKRIAILCSMAIMLFSLQVQAGGGKLAEKKKTYTKSYTLSSSDRVKLSNQFGELRIQTWDRNEIKVDITIVTKASTDEGAQRIMDNILIEDAKISTGVFFKTTFKKDNNQWKDKSDKKDYREQSMKIDYMVYMPAGNTLEAANSFGPMILPDFRGATELESKFGSLTAGTLSNNVEILVEFGKADIKHVNGGKVTVKFSKGSIEKLSGQVDARFEFCDMMKMNIDSDLKGLDLRNSYSTVELTLGKSLNANFDIHTSFGDLSNKSSFNIRKEEDEDQRGPKFDQRYFGTAGNGSARVKIKSDFGKIRLI